MARSHYACPICGAVYLLTYRAADVDGPTWPPICGAYPPEDASYLGLCRGQLEHAPQPGGFAFDVGGVKTAAFRAFDVDVDGTPTRIDSLHTLRRVERESEQRYRNGEGEPLRFRMWNQTHSNRDVNAFGTSGEIGEGTVKRAYDSGTPAPTRASKIGVRRHGQEKPDIPLGPGVRRARSPLKG